MTLEEVAELDFPVEELLVSTPTADEVAENDLGIVKVLVISRVDLRVVVLSS